MIDKPRPSKVHPFRRRRLQQLLVGPIKMLDQRIANALSRSLAAYECMQERQLSAACESPACDCTVK